MKKSLIFFIPTLEIGGAVNILSGIDRKKYKIRLLLCKKQGDFLNNLPSDITISELGSLSSFLVFIRLINFFKKEKPDLFVSNLLRFNIISILAKIISGSRSKIIIIEHTSLSQFSIYFFLTWVIYFLYKKADLIITVSIGIADELKNIYKFGHKIRTIYNPIDIKKINTLSQKYLTNSIFNQKPVIVAVGRLVKAKDYPTLLMAFKIVFRKMQASLVILGEGSEEENLKNLVKKLEISDNVHFLGFKENPYNYMANSSVFVNSSIREGFGNVIVEAMACGVPVVATNCRSGPGEIIQDGVSGLLVEPRNSVELAEAILKILKNQDFALRLALGGQERVKYFSAENSIKNYEKVFNEQLR